LEFDSTPSLNIPLLLPSSILVNGKQYLQFRWGKDKLWLKQYLSSPDFLHTRFYFATLIFQRSKSFQFINMHNLSTLVLTRILEPSIRL